MNQFKIRINNKDECEIVQKLLFMMGHHWANGDNVVKILTTPCCMFLGDPYETTPNNVLINDNITHDISITWNPLVFYDGFNNCQYRHINLEILIREIEWELSNTPRNDTQR